MNDLGFQPLMIYVFCNIISIGVFHHLDRHPALLNELCIKWRFIRIKPNMILYEYVFLHVIAAIMFTKLPFPFLQEKQSKNIASSVHDVESRASSVDVMLRCLWWHSKPSASSPIPNPHRLIAALCVINVTYGEFNGFFSCMPFRLYFLFVCTRP